jgi:hypothetical protein
MMESKPYKIEEKQQLETSVGRIIMENATRFHDSTLAPSLRFPSLPRLAFTLLCKPYCIGFALLPVG